MGCWASYHVYSKVAFEAGHELPNLVGRLTRAWGNKLCGTLADPPRRDNGRRLTARLEVAFAHMRVMVSRTPRGNTTSMTSFDERQKAYESRFAHDEELRFKAMARRNKLLGLWAAERLGRTGPDAEAYAKEVVRSDFDEPGDEDVYRKVRADLDAAGANVSEEELRRTMRELLVTAAEQLTK